MAHASVPIHSLIVVDTFRFICGQFKVLTGRKGKPVSPASPSCRYFDQRRVINTVQEV